MTLVSDDISRDAWAQRVYLTWLTRDTRYALAALESLVDLARSTPVPPAAWICFEDLLNFTGKVSRMLWPVEKKGKGQTNEGVQWRKARGAYLRDVLEMGDGSPLKAREVRNGSEHFDERLDEWIVRLPRPTLEDVQAGTAAQLPAPPMRLVDTQAWTIEVDGAKLDLKLMYEELRSLLAKIAEREPSVAALPPEMAATLATFPQLSVIPFDAPTQRPDEHILTGVEVQDPTDPPPQDRHTAPENTEE
jgi:hypothetical protein